MDYEKDCRIDETALDVEWLNHSDLARQYGKQYAQLLKELQQARERAKTVRSDLIDEANRNPIETTGKKSPNAGDIEAYYRRSKQYKKAKEVEIDAEYEYNYATIAKDEVCFTRKKALENLVTLHGQQYFAGPAVPRDLSNERQRKEKQKQANRTVRTKGR